jgi:hypothetical protein
MSQEPKRPLAERLPTWALVSAAMFSKACQAELTRRNDLFKSQVMRLHKRGKLGNALLGDIANLYRLGALVMLGCLAVMCLAALDMIMNNRLDFMVLMPLSFVATWIFIVVMSRSLEKLWAEVIEQLDRPSPF